MQTRQKWRAEDSLAASCVPHRWKDLSRNALRRISRTLAERCPTKLLDFFCKDILAEINSPCKRCISWYRAVAKSGRTNRQTGVKGAVVPLRGAGCPRSNPLFSLPQAARETLQQPWSLKSRFLTLDIGDSILNMVVVPLWEYYYFNECMNERF